MTTDSANVEFSHFSPDGTRIVFTSDRDGFADVHLMNADGTGRIALSNGESIDRRPRFTRDGTGIIHERGSPALFPNSLDFRHF
jgi:Tol biopolymer transport system component